MNKSAFQFTNPQLKRLAFDIHDDFVGAGKISMDIRLSPNIQRLTNESGSLFDEARVTITLSVGEKDNSTPFYIEADESATFKWEKGTFNESQVDSLLHQNAVALLLSYLRPIISNVTAASPYPAYNLPYIDLTQK